MARSMIHTNVSKAIGVATLPELVVTTEMPLVRVVVELAVLLLLDTVDAFNDAISIISQKSQTV